MIDLPVLILVHPQPGIGVFQPSSHPLVFLSYIDDQHTPNYHLQYISCFTIPLFWVKSDTLVNGTETVRSLHSSTKGLPNTHLRNLDILFRNVAYIYTFFLLCGHH